MKRGKFITFEGTEGVGKTTQITKLATYLREQGLDVLVTKEPGGTEIGMTIRKLILDRNTTFYNPHTEVLLFIADRLEHVSQLMEPNLAKGTWVLCDRYIDSTIAYQIGGREMPADFINTLHSLVPLTPDKTFLLDLPVEEGITRAKHRATLDRFEQEGMAFHQKIRDSYLSQAEKYPDRIDTIDCTEKSVDAIFQEIAKITQNML